jgi:hypothetical protein
MISLGVACGVRARPIGPTQRNLAVKQGVTIIRHYRCRGAARQGDHNRFRDLALGTSKSSLRIFATTAANCEPPTAAA